MKKEYAEYLLGKTKTNYNLIAAEYTRTRDFLSADIKKLGEYVLKDDKVLDVGCANGRLFDIVKDRGIDYYGVDNSERLIEIAKGRYPEGNFQVADALHLPFPDNFFDKVYSISVLHHIPSGNCRFQFVKEIKRVLKPNGFLILRVWDFWQRKEGLAMIFKSAALKILGKSKLDFNDIFFPWKDSEGNVIIDRYFHCFTKGEIENLVKEAGLKVYKSWREGKNAKTTNIYIVAEKQS